MMKKLKNLNLNKLLPTNSENLNDSQRAGVKRSILAFRTITTLLGKIQERSLTSDNALRPTSDAERDQLGILNALATVCVMNGKYIVATIRSGPGASQDLRVLATVVREQPQKDLEASATLPRRVGYQFLINRNPRRDTVVGNTDLIFTDAKNPHLEIFPNDSEQAAMDKLMKYVYERWWVLLCNITVIHADVICTRSGESLESHIWNLMNLLSLPVQGEELRKVFESYVVATCFPKILERLNHQTISQPYFSSLQQLKSFEFKEGPSEEIRKSRKSQEKNDSLLLSSLLLRQQLSNKYPALTKLAKQDAAKEPYTLYSKDTYLEFHLLLIDLLSSFKKAVQGLSDSRGNSDKREPGSTVFRSHVTNVMTNGYMLLRMVQGYAITQHLKSIAPSLIDHRRKESMNSTMSYKSTDEQTEDLDMELPIGKDGQPEPVWKSYLDWLRLILAHIHSVEVLVRFVSSPHFPQKNISIKILTSPNVGREKLPWKEVLQNYIPVGLEMTNETIIKSLSEGISLNPELTVKLIMDFRSTFQIFTGTEALLRDAKCLLPYIEI